MRIRHMNLGLDYSSRTPSLWLRAAVAGLDARLAAALCLKQWSGARLVPVPARVKPRGR